MKCFCGCRWQLHKLVIATATSSNSSLYRSVGYVHFLVTPPEGCGWRQSQHCCFPGSTKTWQPETGVQNSIWVAGTLPVSSLTAHGTAKHPGFTPGRNLAQISEWVFPIQQQKDRSRGVIRLLKDVLKRYSFKSTMFNCYQSATAFSSMGRSPCTWECPNHLEQICRGEMLISAHLNKGNIKHLCDAARPTCHALQWSWNRGRVAKPIFFASCP